ncbi:MAG: asparaginase domain-containing protein [Candidatus Neomarinimicrobiota bacterium]
MKQVHNMVKNIRIIVTGGTFDKEYNELNGELFFKESHISNMLQLGRSRLKVNIRTLMMVDSNDMTDDDRELIARNCLKAEEQRIVITHGTDTMVETARVIAGLVKDKTIVLTGAMIPYTFGSSDGLFNLGSAIAFVQTLPAGVYIAMSGRYFHWDNVRKNKQIGEFETLQ